MVGEQPTDQRAEHRRHAEDRAERALVLAALAQRDDVGDQRRRGHGEATGARGPGRRASAISQVMLLREAARRRRDHERRRPTSWKISLRPNRSPNLPASTVAIVSASRYDETTQVRCPAAAEVADDRRQRRRDDRLVERRRAACRAATVTKTRFIRRRSRLTPPGDAPPDEDAVGASATVIPTTTRCSTPLGIRSRPNDAECARPRPHPRGVKRRESPLDDVESGEAGEQHPGAEDQAHHQGR